MEQIRYGAPEVELAPVYTDLAKRQIAFKRMDIDSALTLRLLEDVSDVRFQTSTFRGEVNLIGNVRVSKLKFTSCVFGPYSKTVLSHDFCEDFVFERCTFEPGCHLEFIGQNTSVTGSSIRFLDCPPSAHLTKVTITGIFLKEVKWTQVPVKIKEIFLTCSTLWFNPLQLVTTHSVEERFALTDVVVRGAISQIEMGRVTAPITIDGLVLEKQIDFNGDFSARLKVRRLEFEDGESGTLRIVGTFRVSAVFEKVVAKTIEIHQVTITEPKSTLNIEHCKADQVIISRPQGRGSLTVKHLVCDTLAFPSNTGGVLTPTLILHHCAITGYLAFRQTHWISDIEIRDSSVEILDCDYAILDAHFSALNCVFFKPPSFSNAKVSSFFVFEHCQFKDVGGGTSHYYSRLKALSKEKDNERQERLFGSLELQSYTLSAPRYSMEYVVGRLYWIVSDFGRSISRPLWFVLGQSILVFGLINYWNTLEYIVDSPASADVWFQTAKDWSREQRAIFETLAHSLGPLGLFRANDIFATKSFLANAILLAHAVLCSIYWFLLLLGIRKRFKVE